MADGMSSGAAKNLQMDQSSINLQIWVLGYVYHSAATSTHVRQNRMVALLCNGRRDGTINKTKQKDKEERSAEDQRRKGKVAGAKKYKKIKRSDALLVGFYNFFLLVRSWLQS